MFTSRKDGDKLFFEYKYRTGILYTMGRTLPPVAKKAVRKTVVVRDICAICINPLEDRTVAKIGCVHKYCFDCIKTWSETRNTCPQCLKSFDVIKQVRGQREYRVPTTERDIDNSFGLYSQLLHLFFTCALFRRRIELGVEQRRRGSIAIFLILVDIIEQLQRHQLMPPVANTEQYNVAHEWMDRVNVKLGGLQLLVIETRSRIQSNT